MNEREKNLEKKERNKERKKGPQNMDNLKRL